MAEDGVAARRWAWVLCAFTVCLSAAQIELLVAGGIPLFAAQSLDEPFPTVTVAVVIGAVVGAAIVHRHPRHRVGWLFCIGQAGAAFGLTAQALALSILPGDIPLPEQVGHIAGWVGSLFGAPYALALLGLLMVLVPDGTLPTRHWWPVVAVLAGGLALMSAGVFLVPPSQFGPSEAAVSNSLAIGLVMAGQLLLTIGLVASAVALVVRLRRSHGEERQQLRWMAAAATTLAVAVGVGMLDGLVRGADAPQRWYLQQLLYFGYLAFQVATGFAVLRYRLYDIDLIIGRTVRLTVLAAFVTAGYVTAVVTLGSLLAGSSSAVWPSLVAYVLVALAFQPVRRLVDRLADRIVYGRRAAPYDSLAALSRQLAVGGLSGPELLQLAARSSALPIGAVSARVTVFLPDGEDMSASWPADREEKRDVGLPVVDRGEILGRIDLELRPGHALTRAQRRLLDELAAQLALAFRNMRLSAALHRRAEAVNAHRVELEESRRRLSTAADTERERVARSIREEVAVHLDPLPAALEDMEERLREDPVGARRTLEQLQQSTTRAIDALRNITAGVVPPLLVRRGLAAAVQAYVARSATPATVVIGPDLPERLGPSVETAAYQCIVHALDVTTDPAQVSIHADPDRLLLSVRGRRAGGMPDGQQALDRIEAVGGQLDEVEVGDDAVEFRAVLPLGRSAQAAISRSGPNSDFLM